MHDANIKLLILWYNKSKLFFNCHKDSADHYDFWNKIMGFPVIIINLFNSSSLLANNASISSTLVLIIGGLAILSTILTGTQNYFEFSKLKDQHTKTMIEYSKINFSIEKILIKLQNDHLFDLDESELNKILLPIEKLKEVYLHIPEKIWKKNNLKFKSKLDIANVNTSDSVNIILNSLKSKKVEEDTKIISENENKSETVTYNNDVKINILPPNTVNIK
jgi:hypothetical protein